MDEWPAWRCMHRSVWLARRWFHRPSVRPAVVVLLRNAKCFQERKKEKGDADANTYATLRTFRSTRKAIVEAIASEANSTGRRRSLPLPFGHSGHARRWGPRRFDAGL